MADIANLTSAIASNITADAAASGLSYAEGTLVLKPAILFIIGMVVYAVFIFKFYRFVAKKDIFELDLEKYATLPLGFLREFFSIIAYFVKYILIFPVFTFFWFLMFTVLLGFLAKDQMVANTLLVSISVVSTIRITSYYDEDLSKDLSKMLPFALLAVFLVDIKYFSASTAFDILKQLPSMWKTMAYYLLFVMALEFVLRIGNLMLKPFMKDKEED